jgi:uncharacterized membrane protein
MEHEEEHRRYERSHDPARLMALSDGVFAIIITLLVLEIHVPDLTGGQQLSDALHEVRPSFVAFLLSFFAHIRLTDRNLVWLNLLYMLPLSLVPFGAALIATYDRDPVALRMYGFMLLAIALTRLFIWLYATNRPHLLHEPMDRRSRSLGVLLTMVPAAIYVLAILIAERAPTASLVIYAGVIVLYLVSVVVARTTAPPGAAERDFT